MLIMRGIRGGVNRMKSQDRVVVIGASELAASPHDPAGRAMRA